MYFEIRSNALFNHPMYLSSPPPRAKPLGRIAALRSYYGRPYRAMKSESRYKTLSLSDEGTHKRPCLCARNIKVLHSECAPSWPNASNFLLSDLRRCCACKKAQHFALGGKKKEDHSCNRASAASLIRLHKVKESGWMQGPPCWRNY